MFEESSHRLGEHEIILVHFAIGEISDKHKPYSITK